jgi:hypothetical protein
MTQKQICVGIVGANPQRSWANVSHVPAINGLSGLRLAAVATRNEQSARKAAEAFGADRWFSDPLAMIGDDQIDVITISVNVPAHRIPFAPPEDAAVSGGLMHAAINVAGVYAHLVRDMHSDTYTTPGFGSHQPSAIVVQEILSQRSSTHSLRRSRKAAAWARQSVSRSSNRTAAGFGPTATAGAARRSTSPCQRLPRKQTSVDAA